MDAHRTAHVALGYGTSAGPARELAAQIVASGGQAVPVQADLRSAQAPAELIGVTEDRLGRVDVLVSNAGLGRDQALEEITSGDLDDMVAVNLRAPFLLAQRVVPGMRERGFGRILFISSVAAHQPGDLARRRNVSPVRNARSPTGESLGKTRVLPFSELDTRRAEAVHADAERSARAGQRVEQVLA